MINAECNHGISSGREPIVWGIIQRENLDRTGVRDDDTSTRLHSPNPLNWIHIISEPPWNPEIFQGPIYQQFWFVLSVSMF
jgi:hypothetical protein